MQPYPHADIQTKEDVFKMGIDKYNEECRSIVMRSAVVPCNDVFSLTQQHLVEHVAYCSMQR